MMREYIDRDRVLTAFQFLLGVVALLWVITQPDWAAIRRGLEQLSIPVILAILSISVLGFLAKLVMWTSLLGDGELTGIRTAGYVEVSVNFVNQLLPSRLSGRVAAPLIVRQYTGTDWENAVAVSITHTGIFALLYSGFAIVGLLVGIHQFSAGLSLVILLSTGLYFLAGSVIIGVATGLDGVVGDWLDRFLDLPVIGRFQSAVTNRILDFPLDVRAVAPIVRSHVSNPRTVAVYSLGWIVSHAVAPGIRLWLLFEGMGATHPPVLLLPLLAIAAYSVTLLPLTPGGIGVTEATATLVFVAMGIPSAVVVPAVLIDRFMGIYLPSLCGWYPTMSLGLDELERLEREETEMK